MTSQSASEGFVGLSWRNTGERGDCGYCDKSLSELDSGTNQLERTLGWEIATNQVGRWGGRRYVTAENPLCAVSTAAMGLNALLEGVSSPRSGVLLLVDKSFSPTVSPVTAQITGLNEAVGFSDRFDGAAAAAGWASYPLPPNGRPLLFYGLAPRRN